MFQLQIPIWREARVALERAALSRDPVLSGRGVSRGDGRPVLLVPGFLAGDLSLGLMGRWLREMGYRPCRAGIRANVDCTARALDRLEAEVERFSDSYDRSVAVIGHSRGGSMARLLAVRRPELVDEIICLGSPLIDQFAIHPLVRAQVEAVAALGTLGIGGFFTRDCAEGDCCAQVREEAAAPFPGSVRYTSIYSRSDGVVDWHACLDPAAYHVAVHSSHCGMAVNAEVFAAVGRILAHARGGARPPSSVRAVTAADAIAA